MRLEGRLALVTGGARGIGRATSVALAREGADVAIGYVRNEDAAQETARLVEAEGRRAVLVRGHLGDSERGGRRRRRGGRGARRARSRRLERRERRDPPGARGDREALGLDARHQRARVPAARAACDPPPRGARRRLAGRHLVARRRCARCRTTCSSARRRPRSRRSSATSASSSPRAGSASTASRAASSRPMRSTTSRTARRCCAAPASTRLPGAPAARGPGARRRLPLQRGRGDDRRPDPRRRRRLRPAGDGRDLRRPLSEGSPRGRTGKIRHATPEDRLLPQPETRRAAPAQPRASSTCRVATWSRS